LTVVFYYVWLLQQEKAVLETMEIPRFMSVSQGPQPYANCPYILVSEATLPDYEDQICSTYTSHKHCHVHVRHSNI